MKRIIATFLAVSFLAGCKLDRGPQGPKGDSGDRGPGSIVHLSAAVNSDDILVSDARITPASFNYIGITVTSDGNLWHALPWHQTAPVTDVTFTIDRGNNRIEIFNGKTAGATFYDVLLIY